MEQSHFKKFEAKGNAALYLDFKNILIYRGERSELLALGCVVFSEEGRWESEQRMWRHKGKRKNKWRVFGTRDRKHTFRTRWNISALFRKEEQVCLKPEGPRWCVRPPMTSKPMVHIQHCHLAWLTPYPVTWRPDPLSELQTFFLLLQEAKGVTQGTQVLFNCTKNKLAVTNAQMRIVRKKKKKIF